MGEKTQGHLLTATRLLVLVLHDVLKEGPFASYADLAEALKSRAARLRIRCDAGLVSEAIEQLERGGARSLIGLPPTVKRKAVEPVPKPPIIGRRQAAAFFAELGMKVPTMAAAPLIKPELEAAADEAEARVRAAEMGIDW